MPISSSWGKSADPTRGIKYELAVRTYRLVAYIPNSKGQKPLGTWEVNVSHMRCQLTLRKMELSIHLTEEVRDVFLELKSVM